MKRVMKNNKMMALALVAMMVMGTTTAALANGGSDDPIELKFLGNYKSQPIFQLNLHNADAAEFTITVKDNNDVVLYSEKLKGAEISRKYRLNTDEIELSGVTFEVTNRKTNKTVTYTVNNSTRMVTEIEVAKM